MWNPGIPLSAGKSLGEQAYETIREAIITLELAPGIRLYRAGGHSAGLQFVSVATGRGSVVLASDVSHFYENMESRRPFTTSFHVGEMLEGFDLLRRVAGSGELIVPGHDPRVMERYPAPGAELEGIVVRLDVAPRAG